MLVLIVARVVVAVVEVRVVPVVPVVPLVEAVLSAVKLRIPEGAGYRKVLEATYEHRMSIIRGSDNVADIETKIGSGQIEELVAQAKDELNLIPHMVSWKPWDFSHQVKVIEEKAE